MRIERAEGDKDPVCSSLWHASRAPVHPLAILQNGISTTTTTTPPVSILCILFLPSSLSLSLSLSLFAINLESRLQLHLDIGLPAVVAQMSMKRYGENGEDSTIVYEKIEHDGQFCMKFPFLSFENVSRLRIRDISLLPNPRN